MCKKIITISLSKSFLILTYTKSNFREGNIYFLENYNLWPLNIYIGSSWSIYEPRHEIFNNVVCATSKASDQPAHMRSLIRAFAHRLNILWVLSYWAKLERRLHRLVWVYSCQNATLLEITCRGSIMQLYGKFNWLKRVEKLVYFILFQAENGQTGLRSWGFPVMRFAGSSPVMVLSMAGAGSLQSIP